MITEKKKLLIITGSFGNGHIQVTNSIVEQLNQMNLENLTVVQHDLFLEAHPIMTTICKKWYINSFKYFRRMYKAFYYSRPDQLDKCFYKYYGLNKLLNLLLKEKPDLILVTFPTPVMSVLTEQFNINIPIATVMTDYRMHKNWITPNSTRYYLATNDLKKEFESIGIPSEKLKVTGIPISDQFEQPVEREAWLRQHQLDPNARTILMSAGAFGVSKGFDHMIQRILNENQQVQVVMICGHNKELKRQLSATFKHHDNVRILGYSAHMNQWMAASHLMITKPGGITISEALVRKIPMIFLNPAPGQELENALYFEEKGFGKIAQTPSEAIDIITYLTHHPSDIARMIEHMNDAYESHATQRLCQDLLDLLYNSAHVETVYGKVPLYAKLLVK
ncbi:diglucosyl diacylglycerol synthase [Staphylococcus lutrae]|uniref:Diglucosyl diacylglycerol synthase n=1 Tax=Staphylococcus lutrae TaxID=155085 RepID=A0AAC9WMS1_9STAP|nr:diglucosyl diacylglycerol synthase [Staphylococcus lutrae]ARJ51452.1 diglucosyl diacylglycerol synthase [Staphylococcus lutrae]PNZ37976.1 diglucosyl diacylglycerol synthase [Staphylococcus lutrae]